MFGNKMDKVKKAIKKKNEKALIELANSKDIQLRLSAIEGMGIVGGDDSNNYLVMNLRNVDAQIRVAAATALGNIGNMHCKAHLSGQLNRETDPQVREAMGKALVKMGTY